MGGKLHLKLNTTTRSIANKYREGKLKRTLFKERVQEYVKPFRGNLKNPKNRMGRFIGNDAPDGSLTRTHHLRLECFGIVVLHFSLRTSRPVLYRSMAREGAYRVASHGRPSVVWPTARRYSHGTGLQPIQFFEGVCVRPRLKLGQFLSRGTDLVSSPGLASC